MVFSEILMMPHIGVLKIINYNKKYFYNPSCKPDQRGIIAVINLKQLIFIKIKTLKCEFGVDIKM